MPPTDPLTFTRLTAREARRRLLARVSRLPPHLRRRLPTIVLAELAKAEPLLAAAARAGMLRAHLDAARESVRALRLPPTEPPGDPPPTGLAFPDPPGGRPPVRFPQVERAAEFVRSRLATTPEAFALLDADAQRAAFTVARAATLDAVEKVQAAVADDVARGGTKKEFAAAVREALGASALADGQIEALYRTHTARAYSAGQLDVLDHPLVTDEFPYLEYSATHDGRVRAEHLALEKMGLDGTAVYRRDDPIWQRFYPPWGWQCRCVVIPLSVEDAAARGVKEAIRWRDTGEPPRRPQWVKPPLPTKPRYVRMPGPYQWQGTPGAPGKFSGMPGGARKENGPAERRTERGR
ncbi:MAG TPA: phage minor head protein [Urbifossiella sp.]|nr:phage minor head protein [Urbifossiella sp.]